MKIAVLLLAAGTSTRMKKPKQLLPIGKETLLTVVINNLLNSNISKLYCVLGAHTKPITEKLKDYNITCVHNQNYKQGLGSSINAGIRAIMNDNVLFDAVLIVLGDQPNVDAAYINQLIKKAKENPGNVISSTYNTSYGVPAIFPKHYFESLLHLRGDKGAKDFLNSSATNVLSIRSNDNLIDIDTAQDYKDYINSSK
ncbi:nucleotidyltransferase family protein [uncultured Winogradskyella sp.]|uniref:nucleotidyltransferase family protein n=1 Tax=uncultured Winogradskyella sp. TaxID=395353 RepID=UPI0026037A1E|nr:nucleotidyltransferase family protein [uncultured Winogradskyella sp.]